MNLTVYDAARLAGCTERQARFLAIYVESEKLSDTAQKLGVHEQSVKVMAARIRRRFDAPHLAAVIARVMGN